MKKNSNECKKSPKLTVPEIIDYCKNILGITFNLMLSVYTKLISSPKIKEITIQELKEFFDGRMIYKKHYFENYTDVKNAWHFAREVLDYYSGK